MCRDGNSASLSTRYLNGQLVNLWENAAECIRECEHTVSWSSEDYEQSSYTRALAQYHFFGKRPARAISNTDDLLFCAAFGKPELKFICNHEAVLYLTVESAHFSLDYGKATAAEYQIDPAQTVRIENVQLAYRFAFSRSTVRGRTNTSAKHLIQLLVLELSSAKLVSLRPDTGLTGAAKTALLFYMHKYLEFLQSAGYHNLFDLPDFEGKFKAKIDYALQERPADLEVLSAGVSVQGTNLQEVNAFLNRQWLNAASSERPEDPLSLCLVELSSSWLTNAETEANFHIRFGPPKITALCQDELILCFDIEDIAFFKDGATSGEVAPTIYHNWKIAFVVNIAQETEDGKAVLRLDFTSARFSSYDSVYERSDESVVSYFQQIVKFISTDYWLLLVHYRIDIVYSVEVEFAVGMTDRDSIRSIASDSSGWSLNSPTTPQETRASTDMLTWAARTEDMASFGFDQVLTMSEHSINQALSARWKGASEGQADQYLLRWSSGAFQASFGAMKVHLLSNGKAIVWISVDDCEVQVATETVRTDFWTWVGFKAPAKEQTTETHQFNDLSIAFEVDLKLLEETTMTLNDTWHKAFESTGVFENTPPGNRVFRHLLLNITNAKYVSELSSAHNLGHGRAALMRLQTIVYYVKEYLVVLAAGGHHIIHSIPTFKQGSSAPVGLTDVSYQIVSREEVTVQNCTRKRSAADAPVVLIVGVCGARALPAAELDWASGLVFNRRSAKTMGMVCLSRAAFLEGRVLRMLARVNAATTIVPMFAGVIDGEWHCDLTTWEQHDYRKGKECRWKRVADGADAGETGYVEYEWQHRDDWNHEHEGTDGEKAGEYHLSCHTRNVVRVPTAFRQNGLELELKGESTIRVSGKTDHQWSMRSVASWSTSILILSEVSGMTVEQTGDLQPIFAEVEREGQSVLDIHALHASHLSQTIHLDTMLQELKGLWEGAWDYSSLGCQNYALANPVFNQHGDLLVQLGVYGARQTVYGTPRKRKSGVPPRLSLRQMTSASPLIRGLDVPLPPSASSTSSGHSTPRTASLPSRTGTVSSRLHDVQTYGTRPMTISLSSQEQIVAKEEFRMTEQYTYRAGF